MMQLQKNGKKIRITNFFFFFSKIWLRQPLEIIDHGQLSLCTIPENTNDPIVRKLSDGRTNRRTDKRKDERTDGRMDGRMDGQMDVQTDESDFIGRCPTNVERPIKATSLIMII